VSQRGSTLIEVLVSVLLFSIAVIGLLRVLATSLQDSGELEYRSVAAALADETLGRMWVDRNNLAAYQGNQPVPTLPNGSRTVTVSGNVITVSVTWQAPGLAPHTHLAAATLSNN
jgi:type IV pilus assembly protein PilV